MLSRLTDLRRPLTVYGWSLIAGLFWGFSYPPNYTGLFSVIAFSLWIRLLPELRPGQAFRVWFVGSLAGWVLLLYWMIYLMGHGGQNDVPALIVGLSLMLSTMAFFHGILGFIAAAAFRQWGLAAYAFFPFLWVGEEYLRALGTVSFPWMHLGYTLNWPLSLLQFLSVGGVYFYSFLVAGTAAGLAYLLDDRRSPARVKLVMAGLAAAWIFLLLFGQIRLKLNPAADQQPAAPKIKLALIQANVDQSVKWNMRWLDSIYLLHQGLTLEAVPALAPDLVVWPEASLPVYFMHRLRYKNSLEALMKKIQTPLLFGALHFAAEPKFKRGLRFYNSLFFGRPDSAGFTRYDKMRLVPFQEALPFEDMLPMLTAVDIGEADFSPGKSVVPFTIRGRTGISLICYEVVYPATVRRHTGPGIDFVIQCTNDAWFGRTGMPYQHWNIARFRAIENGLPIATCANSGFSGWFDACGRAAGKTELFTRAIVPVEIIPREKRTLYSVIGDWPGFISCLVLLACVALLIFRRKRPLGSR